MKITDIRIRKVDSESRLRGIATVTFNDSFVVHDIRIIEGEEGHFIAMPSKKLPNGEFRDVAHPINSDMRDMMQLAVITSYNAEPQS